MFWTKLSEKTPHCRLKQLVKQKKNEEVECLVKNANLSDPVHHSGVTLLHMAARYDNLDLVQFLLESGVDADVRDSLGRTPLTTAILHGNFIAVERLLTTGKFSDETTLQLLLANKVPKRVIKCFLTSLTSSDLDEIADLLTRNHFPLKYLQLVEDASLSRAILERQCRIDFRQSQQLVRRAMSSTRSCNVQTLTMLTRHGPGSRARQRIFVEELSCVLDSAFPSRRYLSSLFGQLIAQGAVDEWLLEYLERVFYRQGRRAVRLMLDCGLVTHVRRRYDQDLLVYAFGNPRLNAVELANKGSLDVNSSRGRRGLRALHYAARNGLGKNVRYLLDNGADANARDDLGITPLFYACDTECLKLLLERGADVQVRKADGRSLLESQRCCSATLRVLLAHVALIEARDSTIIEQKTRLAIGALPRSFGRFYEECRRQIGWMRRQRCFEYGATLFAVLAARSVEEVVPYARRRYSCDLGLCKALLHWYYYTTLKGRLRRAEEICKMRRAVGEIIAGCIGMFVANNVVIEKIVGYLTYEELLVAFK